MAIGRLITVLMLVVVTYAKLYQVVSLFRHGARYHINGYYDGNSTRQVWGELTAVGMRQHQTLGKLLRKDYITNLQFISSVYKEGEIEVYSTDVNRTIQSVTSQLYGLYPLGTGPRMTYTPRQYHLPPYSNKTDANQQNYALPQAHRTIPVKINPNIILIECKNYNKEEQKNINYQIVSYRQMNMTYFPFLKKIGNIFNISAQSMNFSKISSIYDTLTVDKYLGRPMPKYNFTEDDYLNLRHLHYWFNNFKISYNLSRALNTNKFNRIIGDFDDRISLLKNKPLKWTFLSAHDTDISAALLDLNISSSQCIQDIYRTGTTTALNCDPGQQYASSLIFELHSDNQLDYYVKIRHQGRYVYLCERKSYSCLYTQWRNRIKKILVNVDQVCNGNSVQHGSEKQETLVQE